MFGDGAGHNSFLEFVLVPPLLSFSSKCQTKPKGGSKFNRIGKMPTFIFIRGSISSDRLRRVEQLRWPYLRQTILFEQSPSRSWRALIAACIFVSIEVSHHISTSAGLKVIALNVRGVMPPFVASLIPLTTSCFSPEPSRKIQLNN